MKILELTNYSAGICGVWTRVKEESIRLSKKGHQVKVFSSNLSKGSNKIASRRDRLENVEIMRFPTFKLGGESFMFWNFEREALNYQPDIIIAHSYRHIHTLKALKLAGKINAEVFLVTHAPFVEHNSTRSIIASLAVNLYDSIIGPLTIIKFDKVLAITRWEMPYLKKLGVKKDKIEYVPNGIPEEFFTQRKEKEQNKILFLGRISPIKDLETLIRAISFVKGNSILEIVGPAEESYLTKLKNIVGENHVGKRVIFSGPIYDLKKKIRKMDSAKIFVLPSKREAMPQALTEAMAREKIVIASNNLGSRDLIHHGKNGFLFEIGNPQDLAKKINFALSKDLSAMKKNAYKSVEQFSWDKIIKKIENLINP